MESSASEDSGNSAPSLHSLAVASLFETPVEVTEAVQSPLKVGDNWAPSQQYCMA